MPIYKCPSCGRTVEKPEGLYYCVRCGPQALMVKVGNPEAEELARKIPEKFPEGIRSIIRELIQELTAWGFSVVASAYSPTGMVLDFQDEDLKRRIELRLAESGIYPWIPHVGWFGDYALATSIGSVSFEYFPSSEGLKVEGDIPIALATSERSDEFIRDWLRVHHIRIAQIHFHQWYGLPSAHVHIEGEVSVKKPDEVRAVKNEIFFLAWKAREITLRMLQPKTWHAFMKVGLK